MNTTLDEIRSVLIETLGVGEHVTRMSEQAPLLGGLAELDSLAVVELVYALESRFEIVVSDDEVTGDVFETLGTLAAFVESKRAPIARAAC
jgi:acyl carrier protein